jgi:protein-arginine kinase activator protein McsA
VPIYEYQAIEPGKACRNCRRPFELLQFAKEPPLGVCPVCGASVKKVISCCRAAVSERPEHYGRIEKKIKEYEGSGMWSHAAELADKHSEKTKDKGLRLRALDDYKKAGYDVDTLSKHANSNTD